MIKNLIKIRRYQDIKEMTETKTKRCTTIHYFTPLEEVVSDDLRDINLNEDQIGYICQSFENLQKLVSEKGFKLRLDEVETGYKLIVIKDACSASFFAKKEQCIVNVLIQAEDWAEEMLKELKSSHTI